MEQIRKYARPCAALEQADAYKACFDTGEGKSSICMGRISLSVVNRSCKNKSVILESVLVLPKPQSNNFTNSVEI